MYIKFFTTGLCLLLSLAVFAQGKTRSILDWQKFTSSINNTEIAKPVRTGEFTIFQIDNINKFLYKVEIEGKVFELQTPIPSELQTLFRLTPTELQKTVENKKAEEAVEKVSEALPPMEEMKDDQNNLLENVRSSAEKLETRLSNSFRPTTANLKRRAADSLELLRESKEIEARSDFVETMEELVERCKRYFALSKAVATDVFELKKTRNDLIIIAQMDLSFGEISSKVGQVKVPSPSTRTRYIDLKELYHQVELLYEEAKSKAEAADLPAVEKAKIDASLKKVEKADELIEEEALLGLLADVEFLHAELVNRNNFTVVAPPVQMDGDFISYKVTITPAATRTLAAHRNPMQFHFDIPARDGLKVDFSVGPVLSFGDNSRDQKFYLDEVVGTPNAVILRQRGNNNDINPGIAAMMHFYPRTGRNRAFGAMFGVGAGFQTIEDLNLSIYAGPSWVIGKRQKIMLSAGISYLRVDRLKDGEFTVGNQYEIPKIELGNVVEKVFKPSFFLSVSYNLTNRVDIN